MKISINNNMPTMGVKRRKFGIWSLISSVIIGGIMIAAGFLMINTSKINPSWIQISGKVVRNNTRFSTGKSGTMYTPVIEYEVNGQKYEAISSTSSSQSSTLNSQKEVAYDPTNPSNSKVVSGSAVKLFYLIPLFGLFAITFAIVAFVRSSKKSSEIKNLLQTGQKLQGVLVDILNQNVTGADGSSYKIVVSATNPSGIVQNYTSDILYGLGGLGMIDYKTNPVPIDVYIDPTNPTNYTVDVSNIPNLTPDRIRELITSKLGPAHNQPTATYAQPPSVVQPTNNQVSAEQPPNPQHP